MKTAYSSTNQLVWKWKSKRVKRTRGSKSFTLSIANRPTIYHKNLLRKSSEILCIVSDNGSESLVIFLCLVTSHPISGCILFLSILLLELAVYTYIQAHFIFIALYSYITYITKWYLDFLRVQLEILYKNIKNRLWINCTTHQTSKNPV